MNRNHGLQFLCQGFCAMRSKVTSRYSYKKERSYNLPELYHEYLLEIV